MLKQFKLIAALGTLFAIFVGSPAFSQSNDFLDDPAASTQRDEAQKQGVVLVNRTIQGRTQSAVKTGFYGNFFGSGVFGKGNNDAPTVVAGADDGVGKYWSDFFSDVAVWGNVSHLTLEDDVLDFDANTDVVSGIVGMDKFFWDDVLFGVALGRVSTNINSVSSFAGGINTQDASAKTGVFSIYGAYVLNDFVYFDASVGLNDEETFLNSANLAGTLLAQSETDGTTRFGSVGATVAVPFEEVWLVTANTSFLRSITKFTAVRDRITGAVADGQRNDVSLFSIGAQVARAFNEGSLVPYAGFSWEHNFQDQPIGLPVGAVGASGLVNQQVNDQTQGLLTLGVDFFPTESLVASLEGQRFVGREGQTAWGGFFNFRYNF